jgi:hypothetical protein
MMEENMRVLRNAIASMELTDQELDQVSAGNLAEGIRDILEGANDLAHGRREGIADIREGVRDILGRLRY